MKDKNPQSIDELKVPPSDKKIPPVLTKQEIYEETGYKFGNKVWDMVYDLLIDQRDADVEFLLEEVERLVEEARQEIITKIESFSANAAAQRFKDDLIKSLRGESPNEEEKHEKK